ncbi:MAG TPA: hypothetical protein VLT86_00435 [Vicinamibacterales bacterium]|nr:hypothetical protein [Vicinamibacterales bacterium]
MTVALGMAVPVSAQVAAPLPPRPDRPYRGLYGGDTANAQQLLTVSASLAGGYDDDIFAGTGNTTGAPPAGAGGSSSFISGSAQLGYSIAKSKASFYADYGTGTGYYPGLQEPTVLHHGASVGTSVRLGKHSSFSAGQSESYQPLYFWSWLPTNIAPIPPGPTFDLATMSAADAVQAASLNLNRPIAADAVAAANSEYYLASETTVGFEQGLSRNLRLDLGFGYRRADSSSGIRDFENESGSGRLSYTIGKGVAVYGGYGHSDNKYPLADGTVSRYQGHNIDAGVDFNKALSLTRRTFFSFQTGVAGIDDGHTTHYSVIGNVHLTRELGRTWSTGLSYARFVSYTETFRAPALTDSLSAGIGGLISRTAQFQASVGVSRGDVGYAPDNTFNTYFATAGTRFGFTRNLGLSVNYTFYRYSFASGILLPSNLSRRTSRQSFSASIDFWAPLIQRNRSANATR